MIKVRIQVADEAINDTYDAFGLIYMSSDHRFAAPTKGFAKSTYAEEPGEYVDTRTVDDAFDYKVKFCIETPNKNLVNANAKIKAINDAMYSIDANGVKTFKTLTFYNDYKRVKIVGIPQPIAEVEEKDLFRDSHGNVKDIVVCELTIRVNDPSLCDWDLLSDYEEYTVADTIDHWFMLNDTKTRAYGILNSNNSVRGLMTPITKGATIRVTTTCGGAAIPLIIVNPPTHQTWSFDVLWYYDESMSLDDFEIQAPESGWLCVSISYPSVNKFHLVVDNRINDAVASSDSMIFPDKDNLPLINI